MLSEIELMCDRIAVIQNGKLIDIREMSETQESHYYIEAFPIEAAEEMLKAEGFTVEAYNDGFVINAEKDSNSRTCPADDSAGTAIVCSSATS